METTMKRFALLAMALLAGCSAIERPTYREPAPDPVKRPPPPPERILRIAPDFRFREPESGKTYFYRGYRETLPGGGEFRHEIITVLDAKGERDASDEERAYALEMLEREWRSRGLDEQIKYHHEVARIGRVKRDSLIEARIGYAEQAQKDLEEQLVDLEADLQSSTRTAGYTPPPGHVEFLTRQISEKTGDLAEVRAKLEVLRYLQGARDKALGPGFRTSSGS
jgi:hypothetical protein